MDKTTPWEFQSVFLIDQLPPSVAPNDPHLQLLDNYIQSTRFRIRTIRDPQSKSQERSLQQTLIREKGSEVQIIEMGLSDEEYVFLSQFNGREVRANRYFHETESSRYEVDVFLGALEGLILVRTRAASVELLRSIQLPFHAIDVTSDERLWDENLAGRRFSDIREELELSF